MDDRRSPHRASLKNPPASVAEYLNMLRNQNLSCLCGIATAWASEL